LKFIGTQRAVPRLLSHSLSATQGSQFLTEFTAVVVQVFVAGSHEKLPQTDSLAIVHCTQVPALPASPAGASLQILALVAVNWVQLSSDSQGTHVLLLQSDLAGLVHSLSLWHSTHFFWFGSQWVAPLQVG
jgi:hypothetical protein